MINKFQDLFLSFFYLGYISSFPGTLTSFVVLIICYFIPSEFHLYIFLFALILSFYLCYLYTLKFGNEDPSFIVIDEVVGMILSILFLPKNIILYFVAFLLFRFFDIMKPSVIYHSQRLKYGIGIVLDDLAAGFFVLLLLYSY